MNISKDLLELCNNCEEELLPKFKEIDEQVFKNSMKVLNAFKEENVMESDFSSSTGYGYNDVGRDKIERVFARVLNAEDALVRSQIISGTQSLTITLFGLLRPGDLMLSITGTPYDTLHEVIGIKDNPSSLKSFGIKYDEIDLINNDFDYDKIKEYLLNNKVKLIEIQRSRGYSTRESITIEKLEKVCKLIKEVSKDIIIMIDNCYCEFVEDKTPLEVGADIIVGSLIKNLGGGIASNGGYVAGKEKLISLVAERLTVPGAGKEIGPSMNTNKEFLSGLYHAPSAVGSSLKVALLASLILEKLGYQTSPKYLDKRADIVQTITLNNPDKVIEFCRGIQESSAIDSNATVIPTDMPGYDDKIVMASGSFTQGSSIEISADGPLREPYIVYMQGSLSYEYGKIAILNAINRLK